MWGVLPQGFRTVEPKYWANAGKNTTSFWNLRFGTILSREQKREQSSCVFQVSADSTIHSLILYHSHACRVFKISFTVYTHFDIVSSQQWWCYLKKKLLMPYLRLILRWRCELGQVCCRNWQNIVWVIQQVGNNICVSSLGSFNEHCWAILKRDFRNKKPEDEFCSSAWHPHVRYNSTT